MANSKALVESFHRKNYKDSSGGTQTLWLEPEDCIFGVKSDMVFYAKLKYYTMYVFAYDHKQIVYDHKLSNSMIGLGDRFQLGYWFYTST